LLAALAAGAAAGGARPELAQLVAITFTERAAREMRDRIRSACHKRLLEGPASEADYWLDLVRELDAARISTIHAFCARLLRSHAVEARLDPQFAVLDQAQGATLLYESIEESLRSRLAEQDAGLEALAVQFGLDRVGTMIAQLLRRRSEIDWEQWDAQTPETLAARWEQFWREQTLPAVGGRIVRSQPVAEVLDIAKRHPPTHPVMRQRCEDLSQLLSGLAASGDPRADLVAIREAARVQGGGGKKAWDSESTYEQFQEAAKALRELIDKLAPQAAFDVESARAAAETALDLLRLARLADQTYAARKGDLAALDFDDLIVRAGCLLRGPGGQELRRRLGGPIRLLLVDEFQDTDPLQVELVEALCGEDLTRGKLFFVGDYKQSIYRFRGADPRVFRRLRQSMPEKGRLPLSLNFRSQPAILDFVNALFCDDLGPDYEPLRAERPQVGPRPAVEFLWAAEQDPQAGTGAGDRRRVEARWIARRLRAMLDAGDRIVWDKAAAEAGTPATRAVRPGDVAILFRALSDVAVYEQALREYEIPYYLVGGHAFYAQQEIFDLLNLLRALERPGDELSLAGVLRSPFFNLEDETLFWLARHPDGLRGGLLAETLPDELEPAERCRTRLAAEVLGRLRAIKDRVPVAQLIQDALSCTGYDAVLLAEFLGERKLANLHKLVEQARQFDQAGMFTLADFITQLAEFVARQPDEPLAATLPESTDVVRLMTIHQSKGLEFPVVVVPDLDRSMRGPAGTVAFSRQLGPVVKVADRPGGFELHALAESDEEAAELVRLLYVATTRAADYLILSAGVAAPTFSPKGPWMGLLARRFDLLGGQLRVKLSPGYEAPQICVTTDEPASAPPGGSGGRKDLAKLAERVERMATAGQGRLPRHLDGLEPDFAARRQYSFSRLTGLLRAPMAESPEEELPSAKPAVDPLGLGTLVHAVMADLDFGRKADVDGLVRRHAVRHLADDSPEIEVAVELIGRFLGSGRAGQLAAAREVHTELEFLLAWPPGRREPEGPYLQGFIDCLYADAAGQWHLLDYKTNHVTADTLAQVAAGYEMQMLLYALAAEQILGSAPAELVLCFLRPGLEHRFPWNDAARQRVLAMIDAAMAAAQNKSA